MSKYTMALGEMIARGTSLDWESIRDMPSVVRRGCDVLFPHPYPIWDDDYRTVLSSKIITHYYFYEIGVETPARFIVALSTKLNEIMVYYNQLYKTQLDGLPALIDIDLWEEHGGNASQNKTGSNEQGSTNTQDDTRVTDVDDDDKGNSTVTNDLNEKVTHGTVDISKKELGHSETITYDTTDTATYDSNNATIYGKNQRTDYNSSEDTSSDNKNRFSDTPQGGLDGIESDRYLTTATLDNARGNLTRKGYDTVGLSGTDNVKHTGSDTHSKDGSDTHSFSGMDTQTDTHSGDDTTTHTGTVGTVTANKKTINTVDDYFSKKIASLTGKTEEDTHSNDYYLNHKWGRTGAKNIVQEVLDLRDAIINIDMLVINELGELFMQLY